MLSDSLMNNIDVILQISRQSKCLVAFLAGIVWGVGVHVHPQASCRRAILSTELTHSVLILFLLFSFFCLLFQPVLLILFLLSFLIVVSFVHADLVYSCPVINQVGISTKGLSTGVAKVLSDPLMNNVYVVIQRSSCCKCLSTFLARIIWGVGIHVFPQTSYRRANLSTKVTKSFLILFLLLSLVLHMLFFIVMSHVMDLQMMFS